jgi:hypothetical protein
MFNGSLSLGGSQAPRDSMFGIGEDFTGIKGTVAETFIGNKYR